jgi:hypothetical protein
VAFIVPQDGATIQEEQINEAVGPGTVAADVRSHHFCHKMPTGLLSET